MSWLNGIVNLALNVATLGGHGRINNAQQQYECIYGTYSQSYKIAKRQQGKYEAELIHLGQITKASFKTLSSACEIKAQNFRLASSSDNIRRASTSIYAPKAEELLSEYESVKSVAKGVGGAATAGVGSWALVSLLGVASTGTPIIALSGVASTNAILAWFGGGALAAGGAGMAGGMTVLGAIVVVPFVLFTAWDAHSKAAEIEAEIKKILVQNKALQSTIVQLSNARSETLAIQQKLSASHRHLEAIRVSTYRSLFPLGFFTKIWRALRDCCGLGYYVAHEMPQIFKLEEEIAQFTSQFNFEKKKASGPGRKRTHTLELAVASVLFLCLVTLIWVLIKSLLPLSH